MTEHDAGRAQALAAVAAVFERYHKVVAKRTSRGEVSQFYDHDCMSRAELLDAGPEGSVVFKFTIDEKYGNMNGVVHGGAYAVLFDMFTTTALAPISRPGYYYFLGGVTRSLNISYLKAVPVGTTVWFRSRVAQHGRTMALIKGEMTSEDGKIVYATVEHHKVNVPARPEHLAARIPWDDEMEEREMETEHRKQRKPLANAAKL